MQERTCFCCRKTSSRDELVRLVADTTGMVFIDQRKTIPGRGAWVCPSPECVGRIEKSSRSLNRALRAEVTLTDFLQNAQKSSSRELRRLLSLSARMGAVVSGGDQLKKNLPGGGFCALVFADDASEQSIRKLNRYSAQVPFFSLQISKYELGAMVGKDRRAVVAVRRSSVAEQLLLQLRLHVALG